METEKNYKPQSEAMKRAKAKYYQKKKQDDAFVKQNREKALSYYYTHNKQQAINDVDILLPMIQTH